MQVILLLPLYALIGVIPDKFKSGQTKPVCFGNFDSSGHLALYPFYSNVSNWIRIKNDGYIYGANNPDFPVTSSGFCMLISIRIVSPIWLSFYSLVLWYLPIYTQDFSSENAKPTSLLYVLNTDQKRAQWATYENELSTWTSQYLGETKKSPDSLATFNISSKYDTGFTYMADAPIKELLPPKVEITLRYGYWK